MLIRRTLGPAVLLLVAAGCFQPVDEFGNPVGGGGGTTTGVGGGGVGGGGVGGGGVGGGGVGGSGAGGGGVGGGGVAGGVGGGGVGGGGVGGSGAGGGGVAGGVGGGGVGGSGTGGGGVGGGGTGACGAMSCNGCCIANFCVDLQFQNSALCGNSGQVCKGCGPGETCAVGTCKGGVGGGGGGGTGTGGGGVGGGTASCGAMSCAGCCIGGFCVDPQFQTSTLCGAGGQTCGPCPTGTLCSFGVCKPGTGGGGGSTSCGAMTCPTGCCTNGICVPSSAQSTAFCGFGGQTCQSCFPGEQCLGGFCKSGAGGGGGGGVGGGGGATVCNAANCNGCCSGNTCIPDVFQSPTNCGFGGQACAACAPGNFCQFGKCTPGGVGGGAGGGGGTGSCGSMTCASGCCASSPVGSVCVPPSNQNVNYCGTGGQACQMCFLNEQCVNGACKNGGAGGGGGSATCSALNCNGCCAGNICIPNNFQTPTNCGFAGQACVACAPGNICQSGVCTTGGVGGGAGGGGGTTCGLGSCAGCCTMGMCVGLQFQNVFTCGNGGAMCSACAIGANCINGTCFSPPDAGPPPVDAGVAVGSGCLFDGQCKPPSNGLCIPETVFGAQTGWPGGYCSAACASTPCPAGNTCINAADAMGNPNWLCFKSCVGPRTGQSSCRSGYVCEFDPTNAAGNGFCMPRCDSPGFSCWSGTTCGPSGYCVASGPP